MYPTDRWLVNRHGIRLVFLVTGTLSKFDFTTLLIQLTTSLALYKVAVLVVDLIAIYLMPQRKHYRDYKYELTEDFSDVRDREKEEKLLAKSNPHEELGENPKNPFAEHRSMTSAAAKGKPVNGINSSGAAPSTSTPLNLRYPSSSSSSRNSHPRTDYTRLAEDK